MLDMSALDGTPQYRNLCSNKRRATHDVLRACWNSMKPEQR
jgi:hypothetical protein